MKRADSKLNFTFFTIAAFAFLIGSLPALGQNQKPRVNTSYEEIRAELINRKVSYNFQKAKISNVVDVINKQVNFNLIMDERVYDKLKPGDRTISIQLDGLQLKNALKLILKMKGLTAVYENGVVRVVPDSVTKEPVLRFYDIRDLMFTLKDFPGPKLELQDPDEARASSGSGGGSGGGFLGGSFSSNGNSGGGLLNNKSQLINIIKENTGGNNAWSPGSGASIKITNGILIVKQSPEVQKEILRMIDRLRMFR